MIATYHSLLISSAPFHELLLTGGINMQKWYTGGKVYLTCDVRTRSTGALMDPASITCTVYSQEGTAVVSAAAMVKITTGKYYYDTTAIGATWLPGIYRWRPTVTDSPHTTVAYEGMFEVIT